MQVFSTPISTPLVIALTVAYGMCAAITAFGACITQAKRVGYLAPNKAYVPAWTGLFAILLWAAWTAVFLLNWWYALALFVITYCLKELSVLKHLGAWLLRPILDEETAGAVDTAVWAADDIKAMNRDWKNKARISRG
jgi:hypothetical protein